MNTLSIKHCPVLMSAHIRQAIAVFFSLTALAFAQGPRPPAIESPVVHADRTVVFSLRAPNAKSVELSGQFLQGKQPLKNNGEGVWSITVGPVEPDLYPYNFVVDGLSVADPSNLHLFPNERFKPSLVDIPGNATVPYAVQDIPHGEVTYCTYVSKTLGGPRPLLVYTPPKYREGTERYPVFYLVSGTTDTEETWFKTGKANVILDNLIAQKKAVPMVIVMPYGNMKMPAPNPSSPQAAEMYAKFNDELVGSIMPYVESHFRVANEREKRAIAGFSRGGGQSLFAGFKNLDRFAYIGSYAAFLSPEVFQTHFPELAANPEETNQRLKLLWMGVGTEDFLYKPATEFDAFLKERGIKHTSLITGGGHTWMNARQYLTETLQLYFK
jgi:enterochelin esterase family protein